MGVGLLARCKPLTSTSVVIVSVFPPFWRTMLTSSVGKPGLACS